MSLQLSKSLSIYFHLQHVAVKGVQRFVFLHAPPTVYIHVWCSELVGFWQNLKFYSVCICACERTHVTCMYVCIHMFIFVYIHVYVCMCTYVYICMYKHVYVCVYSVYFAITEDTWKSEKVEGRLKHEGPFLPAVFCGACVGRSCVIARAPGAGPAQSVAAENEVHQGPFLGQYSQSPTAVTSRRPRQPSL